MKKNTFLLLACCLFFNIFETKAQDTAEPVVRIIVYDDKQGSLNEPEGCALLFLMDILVTNLDQFPINENIPLVEGMVFGLPDSYPEMEIIYSVGSVSDEEDLTHFNYSNTAIIDGDTITIFKHTIELLLDLENSCSPVDPQNISINYDFDLVDPGELPGTEDDEPYPICDYLAVNDIFACSFFNFCLEYNEVCLNEALASIPGSLDIPCPEDCLLEQEDPIDGDPDYLISKKKTYVNIYPNPFNSKIDIFIDNKQNSIHKSLEIYSIAGRLLYSIKNENLEKKSSYSIDLDHLPSGLYILRINREESFETQKIWKQ